MTNEVYGKLREKYMESVETIALYSKTGKKPTGLEKLTQAVEQVIRNLGDLSEQEVKNLLILDELIEKFYHRSLECSWTRHFERE